MSNIRPSLISHAMWTTRQGSTRARLENSVEISLASAVSPAPNPPLPCQPPTPHSISPMRTFILATIWLYLRLISPSSPTKWAAKHISPPVTKHRHHPRPSQIQVAKSRKSCCRWTKAIIQQIWDTAWDLTTHRNVEDTFEGLAYPYYSGRRTCTHLRYTVLPLCYWPLFLLSIDSLPSLVLLFITTAF